MLFIYRRVRLFEFVKLGKDFGFIFLPFVGARIATWEMIKILDELCD